MIDYTITPNASGDLLTGRAPAHIRRALRDIEAEVARFGASEVRTELNRVLRRQTPYYRLQVRAEPRGARWAVHDSRVVYGPWLEGVGSRNYPATRFRGYRTFRRVAQRVERNAARIAERMLGPILRRF